MRSRLLAAGLLAIVVATAAPASAAEPTGQATAASQGPALPGPVVLLGTGGLSWTDVTKDELPTLSGMLAGDATGWLADRSVRAVTCPVDGWLAVSAGKRAADLATAAHQPACREPQFQPSTPGGSATLPGWPGYLRQAAADTYQAHPGLLGTTLAQAGQATAAVGAGAGLALADQQGVVAHAWPGGAGLTADVGSALATKPDLLVVDLGELRDPAQLSPGEPAPTGTNATPRAEQARALDTRLGQVLAELPANATVIVASLADSGTPSQLQLLAARGPAPLGGSFRAALLGSTSTRQDAIAQTTDLLPTLLTALGLPVPDQAVGSPLRPVEVGRSGGHRRQKLLDVGEAATAIHPLAPWFFALLEIGQVLLYATAAGLLLWRRSARTDLAAIARRRRLVRGLIWASVLFAACPAATFLANLLPWWRAGLPGLTIAGATLVFVLPITALALLGPWRRALLGPFGVVAGVTALVLGADVVTGSHLVLSSLLGMSPVVAGRFYGFGNPAFAIFVTGALLAAVAVADWQVRLGRPRRAALFVVLIGLAATVADGTPGFGSDFGGPPAIIPAFAVLTLLVIGIRVSWRRAVLIAAVTLTAIVVLALLDWARGPGNRTHVGQFVQTAIDGQAWPVIRRKADANLSILFHSWLTALLPLVVAFVVLVLARPLKLGVRPLQWAYDRSPVFRQGLVAFGVLMLIAVALNDSGIAIPVIAGTMALPLLIAVSVRAVELRDDDEPPPDQPVLAAPASQPTTSER